MYTSKKSKKIRYTIFLFLSIGNLIFAQNEMYGTWSSIEIEKKTNKWDLSAETELRTIYVVRLIDRWSLGLNADYNLSKQFKFGVGYQFMNSLDYDKDYLKNYFFQNRFYTSISYKFKIYDFSFGIRERIQLTQKEDRVQSDGSIDEYKINPALVWRNRLLLSYNIPHFKITPSLSLESFFDLNNPEGNTLDNLRFILSFDYKLNKRNSIDVFGVLNSEQNSDDSTGKYIFGLSFKHSLK